MTLGRKVSAEETSTLLDDLHRTGGQSAFWWGEFRLPCDAEEPADTFLRLDGWKKGVAFVNGFNLGRYWPGVGPQVRAVNFILYCIDGWQKALL